MMLKIGSHVSMSGKDMLVGSVNEALSYNANTFMFYTGAPQNTVRKNISELKVEEAKQLMIENGINFDDVIVHAPYIVNLGNTIKPETFELAVSFLKKEIERVEQIGAKTLVLHPGAHVKEGIDKGIDSIIKGLNLVLDHNSTVKIALETMSGKGSEVGFEFSHIRRIIDGVTRNDLLGVCMDTCHLNDSGYDVVNNFDAILKEFDEVIGLDRLLCIHVNDSKNPLGAKKDRHENIGKGYIGFKALNYVVNHPLLENVPKILETPYYNDKPPYKLEIEMFRNQQFDENFLEKL